MTHAIRMAADRADVAAIAISSPAGIRAAGAVVCASIRMKWERVPSVCRAIAADGPGAIPLRQSARALEIIYQRADPLLALTRATLAGDLPVVDALQEVALVPGLGLAKSAFLLQMCGVDIGCLDVWHYRRIGLTPIRYPSGTGPTGAARRRATALLYLDVSAREGGGAGLWDAWCADMGTRYPWAGAGGALAVSALHPAAIRAALVAGAP